jgi:acyl carrier protein
MESDVNNTAAIVDKSEILRTIRSYLRDRFPALADVDAATPLLQSGAIDSLGFLELMTFLSDEFGIVLDDEDFDASNLETVGKLVDFVERKL